MNPNIDNGDNPYLKVRWTIFPNTFLIGSCWVESIPRTHPQNYFPICKNEHIVRCTRSIDMHTASAVLYNSRTFYTILSKPTIRTQDILGARIYHNETCNTYFNHRNEAADSPKVSSGNFISVGDKPLTCEYFIIGRNYGVYKSYHFITFSDNKISTYGSFSELLYLNEMCDSSACILCSQFRNFLYNLRWYTCIHSRTINNNVLCIYRMMKPNSKSFNIPGFFNRNVFSNCKAILILGN